MRRFTAILTAFILCFTFASCNTGSVEETTSDYEDTEINTQTAPEIRETTDYYEESSAPVTTAAPETTTAEATTLPVVTEPETTVPAKEDVTLWDIARVVDFYKNAAAATGSSVQSSQTVGLSDISVNNGQLGGIFSFVTPILSSFLSASATVTDGITGEFNKLTVSDVATAKAYEGTKGTVVEITLNEQTDTGKAQAGDGSVAHGIYVVGDLLSIMGQLNSKGLPIDIDTEKTVIRYSEPVIKAVISEDGKIVNGTWSCTVEISLSDYKFAGSPVDSTRVVLQNTITVNGGFSA